MRSANLMADPAATELAQAIHGYDGYRAIQERRSNDLRLREFLNSKLNLLEEQITQLGFWLRHQANHNSFEIFDRIVLSLKMLAQSLTNPAYNSGSFFRQPISSARLNQIVEYDQHLASQIDVLLDETRNIEQTANDEDVEEILNHLYDLIDGVNQIWSEREFLILDES